MSGKNFTQRLISFIVTLTVALTLFPVTKTTVLAEENYSPSVINTFNGHTYAVFDVSMTWHEAKAYCESLGGYLATITSQAEQDFIRQLIVDRTRVSYWLGGKRSDNDWNQWEWITGDPFIFTAWNAGEPNNQGGFENRINISYRSSEGWNDATEYEKNGFICEWDYIKNLTDFATDIKIFNGHTYAVYEMRMTWYEAKAYCESLGGYLATITSQAEQDYIENLISNGNKNYYWLGGTDEETEENWRWITGENWDYTNWAPDEPNNVNGGEAYLTIYRTYNPSDSKVLPYMWNDLRNGGDPGYFFDIGNSGFICEWDFINSNNSGIPSVSIDSSQAVVSDDNIGQLFSLNSNNYNHELAKFAADLSKNAYGANVYDDSVIKNKLMELGFRNNSILTKNYSINAATVGFAIATKKIVIDNSEKNLIIITVRGTPPPTQPLGWGEWINNALGIAPVGVAGQIAPVGIAALFWFDMDEVHVGFEAATDNLRNNLLTFINTQNISNNSSDNIFLITGHSRGGAVANLLAEEINRDSSFPFATHDNTYVYTFASPNTTRNPINNSATDNIINIINKNDIVPAVPDNFGVIRNRWGRHGKDLAVAMSELAIHHIAVNHSMETYINCLNQDDLIVQIYEEGSNGSNTSIWWKILSWKCPVDIIVYDKQNNVVAKITDEIATNSKSDIFAFKMDDSKCILLPSDDNYTVSTIATGSGVLNFSVETFDEIKIFENIILTPGKEFVSPIDENTDISNIQFFVIEGDKIIKEVRENGTEVAYNDNPSAWAVSEIEEAKKLGLTSAELDRNYQSPTTRAEFCRAAVNLVEKYYGKSYTAILNEMGLAIKYFSDTSDPIIGAAAALGITQGTDNNIFSPNLDLTREQAATMLNRVLNVLNMAQNYPSVSWTDSKDISDWATQSVNNIYALGVINGTSESSLVFSPKSAYTHEQSIATLLRLWKALNK